MIKAAVVTLGLESGESEECMEEDDQISPYWSPEDRLWRYYQQLLGWILWLTLREASKKLHQKTRFKGLRISRAIRKE